MERLCFFRMNILYLGRQENILVWRDLLKMLFVLIFSSNANLYCMYEYSTGPASSVKCMSLNCLRRRHIPRRLQDYSHLVAQGYRTCGKWHTNIILKKDTDVFFKMQIRKVKPNLKCKPSTSSVLPIRLLTWLACSLPSPSNTKV